MQFQGEFYEPVNPVNVNLLCKICGQFSFNGVECATCESLFCEQCAEQMKQQNKKCPENCSGKFETQQPHRIVKDELSKTFFYCVSRAQGCKQQVNQNNLGSHALECLYQTEQCKCGWTDPRSAKPTHQKICPQVATQACQNCKEQVIVSKLEQHNCFADVKDNIVKITEKFTQSIANQDKSIKELQEQFKQSNSELLELKNQQAVIIAEQIEIKSLIQQMLETQKHTEQHIVQLSDSQQQIPQNGLSKSLHLRCQYNHELYFWVRPNGEEKRKKCLKCLRTNVNCRYLCLICKIFLCLRCQLPELVCNDGVAQCPGRHRLQKSFQAAQCSVCDLTDQGIAQFNECKFALCNFCLQARRFEAGQQCPIQ